MPARRIGHRLFVDGVRRAVYADPDGRQYVLGYDGAGTWLRLGASGVAPATL